ncbi:Uncharacterized protein TCAP_01171 [Tolypocladium capitatum]|uniref:Uncharacterized protein n=1 Tax=Tolypocladium capitatum TaxID=45235 RepID=A0A2K3QN04_9HYPO|nr:Uncharacterized protein TCAP_01171 [Tolypocladium capitatum]
MRFAACVVVALGSLASAAAAGFQFPDAVPLERRQTDGPAYQCHANCGYAIQNSTKDGYCKDEAWRKLLDDCLDCALGNNIWQWYGDQVSAAANKCGLNATPKPTTGGPSSAAPTSAAVTSAVSAAPASATKCLASTPSGPVNSGDCTNTTASPAPSSAAVSRGSQMFGSSMLVAGVAVLFAATRF